MVDVITSIDIAAPMDTVTDYAMNQDNAPEWYVNIKSIEWRTSKPMSTGSKFAFVAHFLGRKLSYVYEVVKLSEDEMVMRTADGPFPMETTYRFEKINDNLTRMTLRNRGTPSGFSKLFAPFMAAMMRKANNKDLKSIKRIIEKRSNNNLCLR
ncbi:MAG TPA: SRPBCC family protein [Ohtaekwangia sp.]|nr:SRPBCC family protein [Ohtaekwangia sp.]